MTKTQVYVKRLVFPDQALVLYIREGTLVSHYRRKFGADTHEGQRLLSVLALMGAKQLAFTPDEYRAIIRG